MLDLEAYLARIGLRGRPGVAALHRAHVTTIPFENRDPRRGIPVSLELEDLERKLVDQRRGGYCFEQNLPLSTQRPDGTRVSLSDWQGLPLSEETPAGASVRAVEPGEVGELIASRFGLRGVDG